MYATTIEELEIIMESTIQYKDIDVLEHGKMVRRAYIELTQNGNEYFEMFRDKLVEDTLIERYQIYHDCGKPFCKSESGRFEDHANHSYNQWDTLFPEDKIVSELMRLDMAFHVMRGDDIKQFWNNPLAPTLYLTAWAELEANASMFGGKDSDSYKIKRKRLIQAGKKYISV